MSYLAFISHSSEDTWIAKKLSLDCEKAGIDTFLDETQIAIGARFEEDILEALKRADELIVLMTPWAMERPYVWLEIGAAWLRGSPMVVILAGLSATNFVTKANIPIAIKERNLVTLNNVDRYLKDLANRSKKNNKEVI